MLLAAKDEEIEKALADIQQLAQERFVAEAERDALKAENRRLKAQNSALQFDFDGMRARFCKHHGTAGALPQAPPCPSCQLESAEAEAAEAGRADELKAENERLKVELRNRTLEHVEIRKQAEAERDALKAEVERRRASEEPTR